MVLNSSILLRLAAFQDGLTKAKLCHFKTPVVPLTAVERESQILQRWYCYP